MSRWVNAKLRDGVRVFELSRPPLAAAIIYRQDVHIHQCTGEVKSSFIHLCHILLQYRARLIESNCRNSDRSQGSSTPLPIEPITHCLHGSATPALRQYCVLGFEVHCNRCPEGFMHMYCSVITHYMYTASAFEMPSKEDRRSGMLCLTDEHQRHTSKMIGKDERIQDTPALRFTRIRIL